MARLSLSRRKKLLVTLNTLVIILRTILVVCAAGYAYVSLYYERRLNSPHSVIVFNRLVQLYRMTLESDVICVAQLRMDRQAFNKLCHLLTTRGQLKRTRNMSVEEMVAIFLHVLAHHVKNRVVGFNFKRSGRTISKYFHECLKAVIRCQKEFWKTPEPVPNNSMDPKWKWFKVGTIYILIMSK